MVAIHSRQPIKKNEQIARFVCVIVMKTIRKYESNSKECIKYSHVNSRNANEHTSVSHYPALPYRHRVSAPFRLRNMHRLSSPSAMFPHLPANDVPWQLLICLTTSYSIVNHCRSDSLRQSNRIQYLMALCLRNNI